VRVRVNQLTQLIDENIPTADGDLLPLNLPQAPNNTTPYAKASGTGLNLDMFGQALSGDFDFERTATGMKVTASAVDLELSDGGDANGARGPPLVRLSNASGQFTFGTAGVVGGIEGTLDINVPGISLQDSTFRLLVNTTSVDGGSVTLGSGSVPIPPGPYFLISGTGVDLTIAGQSLSGDFSVEQTTVNGATVTHFVASNVELHLGAGETDYVVLDNGQGDLTVTAAGIAGRLSADVNLGLSEAAGFDFSASLAIAVNTTTAAVGDLPAGPYLRLEATALELTLGAQKISGNFAFEKSVDENGADLVVVAVTGLTADFGGFVTLTNGSGLFVLGTHSSVAYTAGRVSGTVSLNLPNVSLSGTFTVEVNTGVGVEVKPGLHRRRRGIRPRTARG